MSLRTRLPAHSHGLMYRGTLGKMRPNSESIWSLHARDRLLFIFFGAPEAFFALSSPRSKRSTFRIRKSQGYRHHSQNIGQGHQDKSNTVINAVNSLFPNASTNILKINALPYPE